MGEAVRTYVRACNELNDAVVAGRCRPTDEWLDALAEWVIPAPSAYQVWCILLRWYGSHERAHELADWVDRGAIYPDTLAEPIVNPTTPTRVPLLLDTWADLKSGGADPYVWVRLFKETGFLTDGKPAPDHPLTVYRGHSLGRWRGMSWTTNLDCAHGFAEWFDSQGLGLVYEATVPPKHVLALCDHRGESEVVVNPFGLRGPGDKRGPTVRCLGRPDLVKVDRWRSAVRLTYPSG